LIALERFAAAAAGAVAMLGLLLTAATLGLGRWDGFLFYLALTAGAAWGAAVLMRRDRRRRRAAAPGVARPPRGPIRFPLAESATWFALWYGVAVVVEFMVTGAVSAFTLAAIAPFAAFMLATITMAARHIAFRLTAEEDDR
jgi:hypothetical protein